MTAPEGVDWRNDRRVIDAIRKADLVVVNGEGTIHHGRPAARALLEAGPFAASADLPAVLVNCSYQENPDDFSDLLSAFSGVWCRESRSARELESHGVRPMIVPDLTLSTGGWNEPQERMGVLVTDSTYADLSLQMYLYSRANGYTFSPVLRSRRYEGQWRPAEILRHARYLLRNSMSRDFGSSQLSQAEYLQARNRFLLPTVDSYISRLAASELVVSARFHALCFCLITRTPFLAMPGNSHKIEGMLEDAGVAPWRLQGREVLDRPANVSASQWSEREVDRVSSYVKSAGVASTEMFDHIAKLLH